MVVLSAEKERRLNLLRAVGIDVDGIGLYNTFFYYDEIASRLKFIPGVLHRLGWNHLAIALSDIEVDQSRKPGMEIWHALTIKSASGSISHDGWLHDQDPKEAESHIVRKYNIELL